MLKAHVKGRKGEATPKSKPTPRKGKRSAAKISRSKRKKGKQPSCLTYRKRENNATGPPVIPHYDKGEPA